MASTTYPEPTWCVSQDAFEDCSSIASSGPTPFILTGVLVRLLQYHFSDANNITKPQLKGYIWTDSSQGCISNAGEVAPWTCPEESSSGPEDDCPPTEAEIIEGSRILIEAEYARNDKNVQQRPAIYVKREPVRNSRISMQNRATPGLNPVTGVFDGEKHQVNIEGTHSIICVGLTGTEAENIAEEVYFRMLHYQSLIRDDFRLSWFFVDGTSPVQEIPAESRKAFYVVVTCSWKHVHRWMVIPEAPLIKRLNINYDEM